MSTHVDEEEVESLVHDAANRPSDDLEKDDNLWRRHHKVQQEPFYLRYLVRFVLVLVLAIVIFALFRPNQTKQHQAQLPTTCLSEFSTASSWEEYIYRTASVKPDDRCFDVSRGCTCANPFEPEPRRDNVWPLALARNLELVANATRDDTVYDVVLLGDSITEHWLGTNMAVPSADLQSIVPVYHELFDGPPVSPVHGLALGISGDRTSQLLYRLLNGEGVVSGRVYWIMIGINDFFAQHCTPDMIVATTLQSVEMLLASQHTNGQPLTVVLSSILPWGQGSLDLNENPSWNTIRTINHALECYTLMRNGPTGRRVDPAPRVEFFNATEYFLTEDKLHVNATYMLRDMLHPSAAGRRVWGAAISKRVQAILGTP